MENLTTVSAGAVQSQCSNSLSNTFKRNTLDKEKKNGAEDETEGFLTAVL